MRLIGLAGRRRVGKDTFVNMAKKILQIEVERIAFADALKDFCRDYMNVGSEWMYDDKLKDSIIGLESDFFNVTGYSDSITPRQILQRVGTDIFRKHLRDDIWINNVRNKIEKFKNTDKLVCVSDVRFINEIKFIHNESGKVIKILRNTGIEDQMHPSEAEIANAPNSHFDYIISESENTTLDVLENRVKNILENEGLYGK